MKTKTREQQVIEFIQTDAIQTKDLVYFPPSQVVSMLEDKGILVYKMYIVRMYAQLGIVWRNGLWVKEAK